MPPEQRLADLLAGGERTVATAESCTGGFIAHRITSIAGSSAYFLGGVIAYSNAMKQHLLDVPAEVLLGHGAVSRECALAMAHGIRSRSGALIGVSTTGIAGPGGATPTKPVGLVYVACVSEDRADCRELRLHGDRLSNIHESAEIALEMVLAAIAP